MPIVNGEITVTVDADLEVEVFCAECGTGLCNQSEAGRTTHRHTPFISVKPCAKCMSNAEDAGYEKGYAAKEKEVS